MRGHEPLIAMRLQGICPETVHVNVDMPLKPWVTRAWAEEAHRTGAIHAEIAVEPSDAVHRLDLRCLVGLPVFVLGDDPQRVGAVFTACVKAGAKRVISNDNQSMRDSEGEWTWPR
jgi:hypothetical protein